MSISYFTIGLKIWCPTDVRLHLFCHHLLYCFVFLTELAQQNPWRFTVVNSTLWECRHDVLCLIFHSKFGTSKSTPEISLPSSWSASTSKLVPSPPGNPTSLSLLNSNWTNFFQPPRRSGIFFLLCYFIKVSHRLKAKCPGSTPARAWSESRAHPKYSLNKTILIMASLSMGGEEIMS